MAVVKKNSPFEDLSGRVGELVFRRRGGKTIVARRPVKKDRKKPFTKPREGAMSRFREAVIFAREARHQPAFRSLCRQLRGASPYHLAIQDYLSIPSIEEIDDHAVGSEGGPLIVTVQELIAVREVRARIEGAGWIRGRVLGLSAKAALHTGAGRAETQPANLARPALTPADRFFHRLPTDSKHPNAASSLQAGLPGIGARTEASSSRPAGSVQPRGGGLEDRSKNGSVSASAEQAPSSAEETASDQAMERGRPQLSMWRIDLPGGGEVEIVAYDYAGNQAQEKRTVGARRPDAP